MGVSTLAMFYIERVAMDNGSNGFGWNERQKVVTIMDLTETSDKRQRHSWIWSNRVNKKSKQIRQLKKLLLLIIYFFSFDNYNFFSLFYFFPFY